MKLELHHISPYIPYSVMVQYKGIINGKEFSKWNKENKGLDVFEEPKTPFPEYKYGKKTGLIKKTETYLDHWKIRVGNGHKNIYPHDFGKDAFLILRPLSDLEQISPAIWKYGYLPDKNVNLLNYIDIQVLFENHIDVFGLIEKGLAIDINTLSK